MLMSKLLLNDKPIVVSPNSLMYSEGFGSAPQLRPLKERIAQALREASSIVQCFEIKCESCGARFLVERVHENVCECGLIICDPCTAVFEHLEVGGEHAVGHPADTVQRIIRQGNERGEVIQALLQKLSELGVKRVDLVCGSGKVLKLKGHDA